MEKTPPKVSVIIPTYNSANYICDAIQSVLDQSFKDFEIIVIDDGSTDHTSHVLRAWIEHNTIRYIYQTNKGVPSARNAGIHHAKGQFIKFLDADDLLYPLQLENQVHHL